MVIFITLATSHDVSKFQCKNRSNFADAPYIFHAERDSGRVARRRVTIPMQNPSSEFATRACVWRRATHTHTHRCDSGRESIQPRARKSRRNLPGISMDRIGSNWSEIINANNAFVQAGENRPGKRNSRHVTR